MSETLTVKRCAWALSSQQYLEYHDKEWGVPVHDDRKLFEMLILEGVQAVCWLLRVSIPNLASIMAPLILLLLRHLPVRRGQLGFLHVRLIY